MSKTLAAMAIAFAVMLAAIIGLRMSSEVVAVVVGVICGVAAGIPMSLLILAIHGRRDLRVEEAHSDPMLARHRAYPPVVVIQAGVPSGGSFISPYAGAAPVLMQATPRHFRIVGEGEE